MPEVFKTPDEIAQEMLDDFKTITGTELTINDLGREEVIKIKNYAIMHSANRAELRRIDDDTFPASSSDEGLVKHLAARLLADRAQPQKSNGVVEFTVDAADRVIPIGTQFTKDLDGKVFQTTVEVTSLGAGTITAAAESVETGQKQNIEVDSGVAFTLSAAVPGVNNNLINVAQFRDGRNIETGAEMLVRVQVHDQQKDTGGNLIAYERFAREASAQVVTAKALDEPRGPGTVDTVITSGTTDIRSAVINGEAITRLPSAALVTTVQDFILTQNPTTDDHVTVAPTEDPFDVTVTYDLFDESLRASTDVVITNEITIFVLEARPTDRLEPSDLERAIDAQIGHLIRARRVSNFDGATVHFDVPDDKILVTDTILLPNF